MKKEIKKKITLTVCDFSYLNSNECIEDASVNFIGMESKNQLLKKIKEQYNTDDIIIRSIKYPVKEYVLDVETFIIESEKYMDNEGEE